ncbi:hypothetical protein L6452_02488 [Arctium lappa]|uniref:Uncharacterized protein n=1 Tax=Arctium lappa TaxID=4217 RepID=A0ACB9FKU1_ARCLA|nr:hypothetical protein L6452_02488 [Arctium lappa]
MANTDVEVRGVPNIRDTVEILLECRENGRNLSIQLPPSIYMVPRRLRDLSPGSFEPQVVSIGPLHRDDELVQEFEEQKATYLHHLLDRLDHLHLSPKQILDACLHRVNGSIDRIRACYAGMNPYTDVELAQMMVMDASFILEFLFPSIEHQRLISGNVILKHSIFHDLVLLENQIPFFVLQDIFDCTISTLQTSSLTSGVLQRLRFLNPFKVIGNDGVGIAHDHILGLLQKSFHPTNNMPSTRPSLPLPNHSAVELDKAGVKFKPNKDGNWQMAIEFRSSWFACFCWCSGNRILRMPVLYIQDNTDLFLRNVIAYEQCTPDVPNYVTSYACAIDLLVDTKEDLFMLVESKVLVNTLASNEDATNMINNICKEVILAEFYYREQWQQLDRYYNGYWPKNLARLKRA